MKNLSLCLAAVLAISLFPGCTTGPTKVAANPKPYQIIDYAQGSAWGFSVFWAIPIFTLSRFDNAFQKAVKSKGGDGLIDTEISDTAYWTPLGSIYLTRIRGLAIKYQSYGARQQQQMLMQPRQSRQQSQAPATKPQPAPPGKK